MAAELKREKINMAKEEQTKHNPGFLVPSERLENQESTFPGSSTVQNLTEPLLEIFKEEPQLEGYKEEPLLHIPTFGHQPLNNVKLEPKLEPISDPIPEVPLFCALCLRPCTSGQVVEFSAEPSWNCPDVASGRDKLALLFGLELELEQSAICRPCWTMVETLADFRECCLKASAWRAWFSFGLDEAGDDWLSQENVEAMERTRKLVQKHVERVEMAEVEARNRQVSGMDEISEEKPMFEDEQGWIDDVQDQDSSAYKEPKETQSTVDTLVITTHSCAKCQRRFDTESGMKIHFEHCKKSSNSKSTELQLHQCSICSANFTKAHMLQEHRNKHLGIKPNVCRKHCNKLFHSKKARLNHERRCKESNSSDPSVDEESSDTSTTDIATDKILMKVFPCKKCPRKFDSKGGLVNHRKKCKGPVEGRQLHRCTICNTEFVNSNHLDAHVNRHNGIQPYKCKRENCDKSFYGRLELYRHSEYCGKEKPICPLCGHIAASRASLHSHLKTHAERTASDCNACGKTFVTEKSLRKHQQVFHSDAERNFPCSECGKTLKSAYSLDVHRRIHTREKKHRCAVCGEEFGFKCYLKKHMKEVHAGE